VFLWLRTHGSTLLDYAWLARNEETNYEQKFWKKSQKTRPGQASKIVVFQNAFSGYFRQTNKWFDFRGLAILPTSSTSPEACFDL
jgi:hypothetical protein